MDKDSIPVWQTEEWQQARELLLADSCSQCGSTKKLSLVHLWKPPKYHQIRNKVADELIGELLSIGQIAEMDPATAGSDEIRQACPSCQSVNLRQRKIKRPMYKCGRCGSEFDMPVSIILRDEIRYQQAYRQWRDDQLSHKEELIETKIQSLQEEYNTKYRNGEGTITLCGKCSFLWTQKGMKLCSTCKTNYHRRRYDQCYECNQQNRQVKCDKCGTLIEPDPTGFNICKDCYEKMWDEMTN